MNSTKKTARIAGVLYLVNGVTFLNKFLPSAPHVPIQIAHLAGAGGFDDPSINRALSVFIDAIDRRGPVVLSSYLSVFVCDRRPIWIAVLISQR